MKLYKLLFLFAILIMMVFLACESKPKIKEGMFMTSDIKNALENVKGKRIFFGHQSVGQNLIEGISLLIEENKIEDFNLIELDELTSQKHYFVHGKVGENKFPEKKCADFLKLLEGDKLKNVEIAFFKFCYIDIMYDTDIDSLFEVYKTTVSEIKSKFPHLTYVHITSPIRYVEDGLKIKLIELTGRPNNSKLLNIKRHNYNEKIRNYFKDDIIFDLAIAQSTYPDGTQEYFKYKGQKYPNLIKSYTYDGGHLTELGKKKVAADLIMFLSKL